MTTRLRLAASFTALALASAAPAFAALVADLQAPFTVSLKLSSTTDSVSRAVSGGFTYTSQFGAVRFTARDLLADLIADGSIVGPLRGWRIVARTTTDEVYGVSHRLFATKSGQPDYALDDESASVVYFETRYLTSAFRVRTRGETVTASTNDLRFALDGTVRTPVLPLDLAGTGRTILIGRTVTLGDISELLLIPDSIKTSLSGGGEVDMENEGPVIYIVEGTLNFGAHRATAVRVVSEE